MGIRRSLAVLAVAVAATGAGCTGDPATPPPSPATAAPTGEDPPSVDPGEVEFQPGEFELVWNDVTFRFSLEGNTGTLRIDNRSGQRLGEPGIYAILGNGTRSDATIESAAPVPGGEQASFDLSFPAGVDESTVGLVILLVGGNNWGAFAPVPA